MQNGGFQHHPLMRLTLGLTLLLLAGFVLSNFALYFSKMNLDPASVVQYYNGSEEDFRPARTYQSMLEVTHGHLAMMAVVILLLTHLVIFAPMSRKMKIGFIVFAFSAALLSEGSGWLVRFVSPGFAWLKVASFLALQFALIGLLGALGLFLQKAKQRENDLRRILFEGETEESLEKEEDTLP